MRHEDARVIADRIVEQLSPHCERIEIAGSLRRLAPQVGDIEVVCQPRMSGMFAFIRTVERWRKIKGTPTGRYTRRIVDGAPLDLFICSSDTWACNLLVRTGSADFSRAVVTHARRVGHRFDDAQLWLGDKRVQVLEERHVFEALGLAWIEPKHRYDEHSLRLLGRGGDAEGAA